MRHTVHVTVTYSVEVDAKTEAAARTIALLLPEDKMNEFDRTATVFESYPELTRRVKRGVSSY